jgi:hypothetical protein
MNMPEPQPGPLRKALNYAENDLGVHAAYEEANKAKATLEADLDLLAQARSGKRELEQKIADREMELVIDETSKHPSMSVAAMERHLKVVVHTDEPMRSLKQGLSNQALALDLAESRVKSSDAAVRIAVARLSELGGYLTYLAAIKSAQKA